MGIISDVTDEACNILLPNVEQAVTLPADSVDFEILTGHYWLVLLFGIYKIE